MMPSVIHNAEPKAIAVHSDVHDVHLLLVLYRHILGIVLSRYGVPSLNVPHFPDILSLHLH